MDLSKISTGRVIVLGPFVITTTMLISMFS
jgi:hypothetical protein